MKYDPINDHRSLNELIDWTRVPGAEQVESEIERRRLFLNHLRNRPSPRYVFDVRDREAAAQRLRATWPDQVPILLQQARDLLAAAIDWRPYETWFDWLGIFRSAFILDPDDQYIARSLDFLEAWDRHDRATCDARELHGSGLTFKSAGRGWNMMDFMAATLDSTAWTEERAALFLELLWKQFERARHQRPLLWHNMFTSVSALRHMFAVYLPEFKVHAGWAQETLAALVKTSSCHTRADGSNVEQSPNYHLSVFNTMTAAIRIRQVNGLPVPEGISDTADRMARFLHGLRTPDNDLPVLSDSGHGYDLAGILFDASVSRPDYRYPCARPSPKSCLSHRQEDIESTLARPELLAGQKRTCFPQAGYYIMRSSWNDKATYLVFDAGPSGYYHGHQDLLSIMLMRGRRLLLFDPGYPKAEQAYLRGTPAHSTINLDGLSHRPYEDEMKALARITQWDPRPDGRVMLSAAHTAYDHLWGHPTIRRQIFFDGDRLLVIVDRIDCEIVDACLRSHAFISTFQIATGNHVETEPYAGWGRTVCPEGPNLAIRCLNPADLFLSSLQASASAGLPGVTNPKRLCFIINADRAWMAFALDIADGPVTLPVGTATGETRGVIRVELERGSRGALALDFEPDRIFMRNDTRCV